MQVPEQRIGGLEAREEAGAPAQQAAVGFALTNIAGIVTTEAVVVAEG